MKLIVGLGNPGEKYQKTRHNIGFLTVESLKLKVKGFSDWEKEKKLLSEISEGKIVGQKVILAKPQTFMNNSGKAVKKLTYNLQLTTYNLLVIHDDIDLPLGKIRIVKNRGAAGHKGVESIIKESGTKNFVRIRIGIKPENKKQRTENDIEKFVLKKFSKDEEKVVEKIIKKTAEAVEFLLKEGLEKTQGIYNICARPSAK